MNEEMGEGEDVDLVRQQDVLDQIFQDRTVKLLAILAMISGLGVWVNVGGDYTVSMLQMMSATNFWISLGALSYFLGLAIIIVTQKMTKLLGWFISMLGVVATWFSAGGLRSIHTDSRLDPGIGQYIGVVLLVGMFLEILVNGDFGED